jgi:hypothetical protein
MFRVNSFKNGVKGGEGGKMKKKLVTGLITGLFLLGMAVAASASLIGPNVALSETATQSSTGYWGWSATADLAIDGNTDGNYWNGSVSHTLADNNPYAWWEVDLGQEYSINEIDIWNRTDGYGYRLVPFTLSIL